MISIDTVIKSQDLTNNKIEFENMSMTELNYYHRKYLNLKSNTKLINSLSDKGTKIFKTLEHLETLMRIKYRDSNPDEAVQDKSVDELMEKFKDFNLPKVSEDVKTGPVQTEVEQVDVNCLETKFQRIIDTVDDESLKQDLLDELKSVDNLSKIDANSNQVENLFALKNTNQGKAGVEQSRGKKSYDEVKQQLFEKYKIKVEPKCTKTIPLGDSLKLLEDQTKRVQELQMQQAAQKLLEGKGLNTYDYSYGLSENKKQTKAKFRDNIDNDDSYTMTDEDDDESNDEERSDVGDESDSDVDENVFNKRENQTNANNKKFTLYKRDTQSNENGDDLNQVD